MTFHLTVELLDAFDVILRKSEVFSESVNGGHQCSGVLRVLQAKGMTKLMGCHQEQTIAWRHAKQWKNFTVNSEYYFIKYWYCTVENGNWIIWMILSDVSCSLPVVVLHGVAKWLMHSFLWLPKLSGTRCVFCDKSTSQSYSKNCP